MPPDYSPPLWAVGLLTAYHLRLPLATLLSAKLMIDNRIKLAVFSLLPALGFLSYLPRLLAVDWSGRLDIHFYLGICSGIMPGGIYEWPGTWISKWTYSTQEVPPPWIIPLWGLA